MSERQTIKLLIVEDQEIARAGLMFALEKLADIDVVGEAVNGSQAIEMTRSLQPTVILMDIGLSGVDGIEASRQIKSESPHVRIVILTAHDNKEKVLAAMVAGADGYCLKASSTQQLINAIRSVAEGATWLDAAVARYLLDAVQPRQPVGKFDHDKNRSLVSPRELDVLRLIVEGMTNQEIASRLSISPETVKTHVRSIMDKLLVSDRTQAALKAIRQGLV